MDSFLIGFALDCYVCQGEINGVPGVCKNEDDMGISETCPDNNHCLNSTCLFNGLTITGRACIPVGIFNLTCTDQVSDKCKHTY